MYDTGLHVLPVSFSVCHSKQPLWDERLHVFRAGSAGLRLLRCTHSPSAPAPGSPHWHVADPDHPWDWYSYTLIQLYCNYVHTLNGSVNVSLQVVTSFYLNTIYVKEVNDKGLLGQTGLVGYVAIPVHGWEPAGVRKGVFVRRVCSSTWGSSLEQWTAPSMRDFTEGNFQTGQDWVRNPKYGNSQPWSSASLRCKSIAGSPRGGTLLLHMSTIAP